MQSLKKRLRIIPESFSIVGPYRQPLPNNLNISNKYLAASWAFLVFLLPQKTPRYSHDHPRKLQVNNQKNITKISLKFAVCFLKKNQYKT